MKMIAESRRIMEHLQPLKPHSSPAAANMKRANTSSIQRRSMQGKA